MPNWTIKKSYIGATDIAWGTGTFTRQKSDGTYMNVNQVKAASIPILDTGIHFAAGTRRVEYAIGQNATRINVVSASLTTKTNVLSASFANFVTSTSQTNQSATIASLVKYWWRSPNGTIQNTSSTRITIPSGYYPVGGKLYYAANTLGWSTQRGGGSVATQKWSNRGFSFATGAVALGTGWRKSNTWYYLYATKYENSLALVCAGTSPTTKYDNNLWGSDWNTNTYLGAIRFQAASNVAFFKQSGNKTSCPGDNANLKFVGGLLVSWTNDYIPVTARKPSTADLFTVRTGTGGKEGGTLSLVSIACRASSPICYQSLNVYTTTTNLMYFQDHEIFSRANTPTTIYISRTSAAVPAYASLHLQTIGWVDKFN